MNRANLESRIAVAAILCAGIAPQQLTASRYLIIEKESQSKTTLPPGISALTTKNSPRSGACYLTAMIDGQAKHFQSAREKFEELAASWKDAGLGRSIIDYHDFSMIQIIGMGATAMPFLVERLELGEVEWIFAMKGISGQEADTPDMLGDEELVIKAWIDWGKQNGNFEGQARRDETIHTTAL